MGRITTTEITEHDGVKEYAKQLLEKVAFGTSESKERALATLWSLADQSRDNAAVLRQCESVAPLVGVLSAGTPVAQERAAGALACIMHGNAEYQTLVMEAGALVPLAAILRSGGGAGQEQAAAAFARLSEFPESHKTILKAKGIPTLIDLLSRGSSAAQVNASQAVANLCTDNLEAQHEVQQNGGVRCLLKLLGSGRAQEHAARAIACVAHRNGPVQGEVCKGDGIPKLLSMLSDRNVASQIQAAAALGELAQGEDGNGHRITQDAISHAGGIGPLLAMVEAMPVVHKAVAESVKALAEVGRRNRANQDAIAQMGGVKPLVELLQQGSNPDFVQQNAALALTEICRGGLEKEVAPLGLKWKDQGTTRPAKGWELQNHELASALRRKVEFEQEEFDSFGVTGLRPDSIIRSCEVGKADRFYTPRRMVMKCNVPNQTAVADIGGIGQLVVLLRLSGKTHVEAEVAGALWTVSINHVQNKISIASAGAIPTLVNLLGSPSERAQSHAGSALASLALDNVDNQKQEAPLLVGLLGSSSERTQKLAAKALWRMIRENPDSHTIIAKAGGAEATVRLLRDGSAGARKYALWSLSLSIDKESQETVSEAGGVKPLVASLSSDNVTVTEQAAAALAKLATANRKTQEKIAAAGGIAPLIALIDRGASDTSQQNAAAALAELALLRANKTAIDRAGGISPLVSLLLFDGAYGAKKFAASALARLSTDGTLTDAQLQAQAQAAEGGDHAESGKKRSKSEQIAEAGAIAPLVSLLSGTQGQMRGSDAADAQEEAAGALLALAGESSNRVAITESGGIGPLVLLLGCDNPIARQHAEGALVRLSIENANRVLIIKQLVEMLYDSGTAAQEQAAAALANLARDSTDNRKSIVESGGIPPLLALLESESSRAKENAASAITQLCATKENQDAIREAKGIQLLVSVLTTSSSGKETSAVTLCSLAAMAIWQLATKNQENQVAIEKAGAITPLVSMLGSPSAEMQSNAAGALSCLASDNQEIQSAIARTGAIAPLCALVREGSPETKETCASALWALSADNAPNKATIAKLGGIEPLVGLLVGGATEKSQAYAAGALASLSSKHSENRTAIAKRLVGLLNGRAVERAVRVLHALSELSIDHSANQVAIAKAGGIPPVITWLGNAAEEAQREAAHALLSISSNNITTQTLIAKSGGIPPLITLVDKSSVETQEYAARALWHLASSHESQQLIAEAGGIPPLVAMLSAEGQRAPELAALTIVRLADGNPEVSESISNVGGIVPLVKLLSMGSPEAQQQSAAAIAELALVISNRDAIAHYGGIPPLINLLSSSTQGTPESAARALANIAKNNCEEGDPEVEEEEESDDEDDEGDDDESAVAAAPADDDTGIAALRRVPYIGGPSRRAMIKSGGGIKKLIAMLDGSGDDRNSSSPKKMAGSMWSKVSSVVVVPTGDAAMFTAGRTASVTLGSEEQAAAALCSLAYRDDEMQDAIIMAGGVPSLLQLLRMGSPLGQEHAARAIWYLCANVDNQTEVVEKGCIPELVSLAKHGSAIAQEVAAAGISELANGAIEHRNARQADAKLRREREKQAMLAQAKQQAKKRRMSMAVGARAPHPPQHMAPRAARVGAPATDSTPSSPSSGSPPMERSPVTTRSDSPPPGSSPAATHSDAGTDADEEEWMEHDRLTAMVRAGGIAAMVPLLTSGTALAKEYAAAALWHFAIDKQNQNAIAKANGIAPIVLLLDSATFEAAHFAARALARLSQESADMQAQIAKRLVQLLGSSNTGAQERSAHALFELAKDQPSSPIVIVNAGAISPLVNLLSHGTLRAKKESSSALARLAMNNPKNQLAIAIGLVELLGSGEDEAQEEVTKLLLELATDRECRAAIAEAGAIQKLLVQIKGTSIAVHEYASAVLAHLTSDSQKNVRDCAEHGGIKPLVALLASESVAAQAHAAKVLADMSRRSTDNQAAVVHEGGITPLVALLSTGFNAQAKAEAAGALWSLATGLAETQAAVAEAGAIVPLVQLLAVDEIKAQIKAAGALAAVANGSPSNQNAIRAASGIEPLVGLLDPERQLMVQAHAAEALAELTRGPSGLRWELIGPDKPAEGDQLSNSELAEALARQREFSPDEFQAFRVGKLRTSAYIEVSSFTGTAFYKPAGGHAENQGAVATAGAIKPLINILRTMTVEADELKAKEAAAGALWSLSSFNFDIQTAVAEEGGIPPLVMLLGVSSSTAQKQAAGALASLALDNELNEKNISTMMIELLTTSTTEDAPSGAAEKAARAVSRLARAHASNQAALARAGGINVLISMVDDGHKSKQFLAAQNQKGEAQANREKAERETKARMTRERLERISLESFGSLPSDEDLEILMLAEDELELAPAAAAAPAASAPVAPRATTQGTVWSSAAQKEIAGALWSMAEKNPDNQASIAEAGGVPLLIRMVQRDAAVQRNAAGALWSLAQGTANQTLIADMNGIPPLVDLLVKGSSGAQETAAGALHTLAALESNRTAIAEANGIEPLVALFDGGSDAAKVQAAGALSVLVVNNESNQNDVATGLVNMLRNGSVEAQAHVTALVRNLSLDPENRGAIAKAGAIEQLVRQLQDGSDETQSLAASALSQIALKSSTLRVQVTQQLVRLLGKDSEEVRQRAGIALRDMAAEGGDESQKLVAMAGGVVELVVLLKDGLRDGRVEAQEYALWSLSLATDANSRATIVQEGCTGSTVTSLKSGFLSAAAEEHAACVLSGLARDIENSPEIVKAGAIPPLVKLLGEDSTTGAKKHAANAIARLASSSYDTQLAIAKAGAITALAKWLTNDTLGPGMSELAARSLADIAADNPLNADAIVKAKEDGKPLNAIANLIAMLKPGRSNDAQRSASGTLATLAKVELPPLPPPPKKRRKKKQEEVDEQPSSQSESDDEPPPPPLPRYAPIAELGGIPLLVDLLRAERLGPHENASRALWHLAGTGDNKLAIADVGGIPALVHLLTIGSEATQRYSAAAMHSLARECPENQIKLAKAKAIQPLVLLLGAESMETQDHSVRALLCLASHPESRNAVIKRLVAVLDARNSAAQMRSAAALAVLSSRNTTYRSAIMEAGAIPPLVRLLGDGLRVENDTPQERAACVLADLARSSESKEEIVESEGIVPLVRMLASTSEKAQTAAAAALHHLSSNGENKIAIAQAGGIPRLVVLLSLVGNADGQAYAAAALRLLSTSTENKVEIISHGGIPNLVQMMVSEVTSADAVESAAAVLSEIARMQHANKLAIVEAGGVEPLVKAAAEGSPGAKRCAAATLWGLSQSDDFKQQIITAGAVPPLVALLTNPGESQSYSVASLNMLAVIPEAKKNIFLAQGVEPLMEIAKNATGAWLRGQAVEVLSYLGIKDPREGEKGTTAPLPPMTPRTGAMPSARGKDKDKDKADPEESKSVLVAGSDPPDVAEAFLTICKGELVEVAGNKALQLRAKFELTSEKAGELPLGKPVHVLEQKMTDDGKTRMCVTSEADVTVLGWLTGSAADGKKNLKVVGRPVCQVVSAKPLVARYACDLTADKSGELAPDVYIQVLESKKMPDGSHRIGYALEGKEKVKAWVTGMTKDGAPNVEIIPGRRTAPRETKADDDISFPEEKKEKDSKKEKEVGEATPEPAAAVDEPKLDKTESKGDKTARRESKREESKREAAEEPKLDKTESKGDKTARRESKREESKREDPPAEAVSPTSRESKKKEAAKEKEAPADKSATTEKQAATVSSQEDMPPESPTGRGKNGSSKTLLPNDGSLTSRRKSEADSPQPSGQRKSFSAQDSTETSGDLPSPQPTSRKRSSEAKGQAVDADAAKAIAKATAPAAGPSAVRDAVVVRTKLKMRAGAELDSDPAGEVRAGTRVHVIEQRQLADGTNRSCLALEGKSEVHGWVSTYAKDGQGNLLDPQGSGSAPSSKPSPEDSQATPSAPQKGGGNGSAAKVPLLPPSALDKSLSSASLPTARSTAKATAAVGVVKSSLPAAAVAAAAAAARESVAAQAAAVKEAAEAARGVRSASAKPLTGSPAAASAIVAAQAAIQAGENLTSPSPPSPNTKASPRRSSSFHAHSPKGVISPRMSSPRGASPGTPSTGRAPSTPGRAAATTPRTPGRGQPRRNEPQRSHPSQSR